MLSGIVALSVALRLHTVTDGVESREEAVFYMPPVSIADKAGIGVRLWLRRKRSGCWSKVLR
jgi:hypothetical protein